MAKKRLKKGTKRRLTIFGTASIIAIVYFIFTISCQVYNVYNVHNEKLNLQKQYSKLKEEAEDLNIEINQLNIYFIFTLSCQVYNLYQLNIEKSNLQTEYRQLKEKASDLKIEINQLNDPEYLAKYARENYSYSKEGEYIIKLKEKEEEIEETNHEMNKEYIVIGLSIFLVIIFIYVIKRGNKKNR